MKISDALNETAEFLEWRLKEIRKKEAGRWFRSREEKDTETALRLVTEFAISAMIRDVEEMLNGNAPKPS